MNRYHLEVITHNGIFPRVVEADHVDSNSDGFYRFTVQIENNKWQTVACYPIVNTIIEKIEYDIN